MEEAEGMEFLMKETGKQIGFGGTGRDSEGRATGRNGGYK